MFFFVLMGVIALAAKTKILQFKGKFNFSSTIVEKKASL